MDADTISGPAARGRDRSLVALAAGFVLLVAAVLFTSLQVGRQQEAFDWVRHTLEVENQISRLMASLQDVETGGRGYLLTSREEMLEPYDEALRQIPGELAQLRALVRDNAREVGTTDHLARLSRARIEIMRAAVEAHRNGQPFRASPLLSGKQRMDEIRDVIADMRAEESRLLALRIAEADRYRARVIAALLLATLMVIALGVFAFLNSRRQLREVVAEARNREAAETQLRQMQKIEAVGQLTGGIAHDFNNMLTLVIGSLDLAKRRMATGERDKVEKCVDNAMEGAQRASQLTARLLAFSRQQPLAPQPIDANKLVGSMSELLRRTIGEHLQVETVLAGGLWRTFVDPNQLENAIVNLCVNARDAMPDGGKLTIETGNAHLDDTYAASHAEVEAGQYVAICVTDTGTGMTAEVAERAIDPFYTTKGPGRGTGLGLSQVFGFVKQSLGHFKIYSEIDHGTTVKIYLPRYTGAEDLRPDDTTPADSVPRARENEIVLVVEDEERVRHVSVDALRELGYTVVQASDASQALAILAVQPNIDLLFTDVVMPEMNGRQLVERARTIRPDLHVLYTTGYTRNAIVHNGMLDADVAFIAKPFTVTQLARKVRSVLDET